MHASNSTKSHTMHLRISRDLSQPLAIVIKDDPTSTEKGCQTHVQHDSGNEATALRPWRNELAQAVAPEVFVHSNGDEDASGNGLVAVDSVRAGDRWKCSYLDSNGGIADYHDYL